MCTEEGRLRTIGVALSFKVRNSRSWLSWLTNETSKLLRQTLDGAEMRPTTAMPDSGNWLPGIAFTLVGPAGFEPATP